MRLTYWNASASTIALMAVVVSIHSEEPTVLWTYSIGSRAVSSPAIAQDGTVYLGTTLGLSALTNSPTLVSNKWTFVLPIYSSSPAVGSDGVVYIAGTDGSLYAIRPDGSKKWAFPAGMKGGSAAIGPDGTIYLGGEYYLYALSAEGTLKWKFSTTAIGASSPSIASDGTIYVGGGALHAANPDGTERWTQPLFTGSGDSCAIGNSGVVYLTGGFLFAFSPEGTQLLRQGDFAGSSPIVGQNGLLYLEGFGDHKLHVLDPSGLQLWEAVGDQSPQAPLTCAALDKSGRAYFSVSNSIWALSSQGLVLWEIKSGNLPYPGVYDSGTSPTISADGTLYAALGEKLYAIATGTNGPADSPWPMYRGNAQHTGRIQKPSLQNPKKRADANFEFQLFSQTGTSVSIESSTNLTTWNTLTSVVPATAPEPILDLAASNSPAKFYRAKGGG